MLPVVPLGTPGYKFRHPVDSPEGQNERREHERLRKQAIRASAPKPLSEPPPLPPASGPDQTATQMPGQTPGVDVSPVEVLLAWKPEDVAEFTDELVELSEAKRVADFLTVAREAKLPPKLLAEIERDAEYGVKTKAGLKRAIAATAAKWLNRSGLSAKNKEETALLFCLITIKMQGVRARKDMHATIAEFKAQSEKTEPKKPRPGEPVI